MSEFSYHSAEQLDPDAYVNRAKGFNLAAELHKITGPVIEVGGPTPSGYTALDADNAVLPERPFVFNRHPELTQGDSYDSGEWSQPSLTMDTVADAGALPLADNSVGVALASRLPTLELSMAKKLANKYRNEQGDIDFESYAKEKDAIITALFDQALDNPDPEALRTSANPLIKTVAEFSRVLRPDGLAIVQDIADWKLLDILPHLNLKVVEEGIIGDNSVNWVVLRKIDVRHQASKQSSLFRYIKLLFD